MDKARLPPNQVLTEKFPVVGERDPGREIRLDEWRLQIEGEVDEPCTFDYAEILALPQFKRKTDIHCVTGWSRLDTTFTGFPLRHLFEAQGIRMKPEARFIRFVAYSGRNHDVTLPVGLALDDSWLVHSADGEPLSISRGYPLRLLTPSRYLYKSLKWVHRIILQKEDHPGFWERASGYHNNADPWEEERLSGHRFTGTAETEEFKNLSDFDAYRHKTDPKVVIKANFNNWQPGTTNLRGLHLKACSFKNAELRGIDFTNANLSLSKFEGANLENVDFTGADLEGADFSGSYLAGAVFDRNFLSATTFSKNGKGLLSHEGATMNEPDGLIESQERYLQDIRIIESAP